MENKSPVIVTGYAGMIGSALVRRLNEMDIDVMGVEDLSNISSKLDNINSLKLKKVYDKDHFLSELANHSTRLYTCPVVHLGACSSTDAPDEQVMKENYRYTLELLKHSPQAKIILASSAGVYGNKKKCIEEAEHEECLTAYAYSKKIIDDLIRVRNKKNEIALRFFNVCGPGEEHKEGQQSPFYRYLKSFRAGSQITLLSDEKHRALPHKRDFIWVEDCIDVIVYFLESERGKSRGIYNVGTGVAHSFLDVANACYQEVFNTSHRLIQSGAEHWPHIPPFSPDRIESEQDEARRRHCQKLKSKSVADDSMYQRHTCADLTKLRDSGYKGTFLNPQEIAKEYLKWFNK